MTNYNCKEKEKLEVLVEDIKCFQCKKKFLTQNLFEWHSCFLKTRGSCSKCGLNFKKKQALFKHYVFCEGRFKAPEAALHPVKVEGSKAKAQTVKAAPKEKAPPPRKMSTVPIVKTEVMLGPPPDDDNYEGDITYDNFGNDSDSDDDGPSGNALEPEVNLQEQIQENTVPSIRIKKEKSDAPTVQQSHAFVQSFQIC